MLCEHTNQIFCEGTKVCTSCGLVFPDKIQYVVSYNHNYSKRRPPVYSRQKRFYNFIRSHTESVVRNNLEDIIQCFTHLEFFYQIYADRIHSRKYFFNRRVTLAFIIEYLGIEPDEPLQTLKDQERVDEQFRSMAMLAERHM